MHFNHDPLPKEALAQIRGGVEGQQAVFEDADFGIQAARDAGMDAVDVRLL